MTKRDEGRTISRQGLSTAWERGVTGTARVLAVVVLVAAALVAVAFARAGVSLWLSLPLPIVLAYLVHYGMTRRIRRRRAILAEPFLPEWEEVLQREVIFFRALEPGERQRFRRDLQVFLGEKLITGIGFKLDTTTRVLTAASAVIPIFGFPDWEWDQISEVLVYPGRFDGSYDFDGDGVQNILGMVGTGAMNRLMILSKPDLLTGFRNQTDRRNVGVHEFAHLVDKSDGSIDGLPGVGLEREAIGPWIELVRRKMEEIRRDDSDINPYGLTNEAEFFAVATEYFFERPGLMEHKHPELFAMLSKVFGQDLRQKTAALARERKRGRPKFGRNSPCPCGSGKKYKKCCLNRSRR